MEKRAVERLKNDLLNKKSHDIFKNVQALWDLAYATNDMELNYKLQVVKITVIKNALSGINFDLTRCYFAVLKR